LSLFFGHLIKQLVGQNPFVVLPIIQAPVGQKLTGSDNPSIKSSLPKFSLDINSFIQTPIRRVITFFKILMYRTLPPIKRILLYALLNRIVMNIFNMPVHFFLITNHMIPKTVLPQLSPIQIMFTSIIIGK